MRDQTFFPVAVWYNGSFSRAPMMSRTPLDEVRIKEDLNKIKNLGFNSIKYWVDWATCNPKPGKLDFTQVEKFMDIIGSSGLKVVVQIYLDSAPNWIADKYPDALFRSQSGQEVESQASPGYSLDHPEVRSHAAYFLKALSKLLAKYPSFYAWDVWSEPHVVNWSWFDYMGPEPWFDYNVHTLERFKKWLIKKYNKIENLNNSWYRTYKDWNQVRIPKYVTLSTYQDIMDWQAFTIQKMKEDLEFRVKAIRSQDTKHLISSHSAITSTMTSIMDWGANGNDWEMSKVVDVWGTSFYPAHIGSLNPYDPSISGVFLDASRSSCDSSNVPFWIGELQCGQAVEGMKFGMPVDSKEISLWTWTCLSRGSKGLFFYAYYPMSCGEEISGFGMVPFNGELNDRAREAGRIAKIINQNMRFLLSASIPPSKVAILVSSEVSAMLSALRAKHSLITSSLMGTYRILFNEGIYPTFIDFDNITLKTLLSYNVIFAPLLLAIDKSRSEMLRKYVKSGGTLISEFRPGWSDLEGNSAEVIPGADLDSLFGVKESYIIDGKKVIISYQNGNEKIEFDYNNQCEILEPTSASVIATADHDQPIITDSSIGNGHAILIGMLLTSNFENTRNEKVQNLVLRLIHEKLSILRTHPICAERSVEVRELISENGIMVFAFNHMEKEINSSRILVSDCKYTKAIDLINDKALEVTYENNNLILNTSFKKNEIKVIRLT